jgi:monoterpene epsilon-lactone hydrolase
MASLRARFYNALLRKFIRDNLLPGGEEGLKIARERMSRGGVLGALTASVEPTRQDTIHGCYSEWLGDPNASHTLLYLHGGGYTLGSPKSHRAMVRQMCKYAGVQALVVDYRLAPENPFPAAIEDAEAAYDFLVAKGVAPENMLLAGDSAGGGLSLALMLTLKEKGKAQPKAVALLSPWTDLTASGASLVERADRDPMIDATRILEVIDFYRGDEPATNPRISPLFADLSGLPPMLVQVGTEEVLFDDSTRLVDNAKAAGVSTELEVWQGMAHVHQLAHKLVPESRAALESIGRFFRKNIA